MPHETVDEPCSEIAASTVLLLLDALSNTLLDAGDIVAGDPDVRLAASALSEQVRQQLTPRGHVDAIRNHRVIRDTANQRCR
jgi:hypothetical protein